MTKSEALIKRAVERYPLGTKIVDMEDNTVLENVANRFVTSKGEDMMWMIAPDDSSVLVYDKTYNKTKTGIIEKWAEIEEDRTPMINGLK